MDEGLWEASGDGLGRRVRFWSGGTLGTGFRRMTS